VAKEACRATVPGAAKWFTGCKNIQGLILKLIKKVKIKKLSAEKVHAMKERVRGSQARALRMSNAATHHARM
jgi:hypothetical protein